MMVSAWRSVHPWGKFSCFVWLGFYFGHNANIPAVGIRQSMREAGLLIVSKPSNAVLDFHGPTFEVGSVEALPL